MLNDVVRQVVSMTGATGSALPDMSIITQKAEKINYITFDNLNSNIVEIYPRFTDPNNVAAVAPMFTIGVYGCITRPFTDELKNGFLAYWTNAESGTNTQVKGLSIYYSETNLQMNTSQAPGFNSTLPSANVDIVGNTIGLVEADQLPTALTAAGNLKVDIMAQSDPVDSTNLFVVATSTANNAVTAELGATAGGTYYISGYSVFATATASGTAETSVQVLDGTTVLLQDFLPASSAVGTGIFRTLPKMLKCTTGNAAKITVAAAGAGCITVANLQGVKR